jgi:fatty acid desaturase
MRKPFVHPPVTIFRHHFNTRGARGDEREEEQRLQGEARERHRCLIYAQNSLKRRYFETRFDEWMVTLAASREGKGKVIITIITIIAITTILTRITIITITCIIIVTTITMIITIIIIIVITGGGRGERF